MAFQFRVDGQGRVLQRSIIPDGVSTVLEVDFSEDFQQLHVFDDPTGLYGPNEGKGKGTGADATDSNSNPIAFTLAYSGPKVTYTFASPPKDIFWVWAQFLVTPRGAVRTQSKRQSKSGRKHK